MGSYGSLSLGASGNVTYSGILTPSGTTYNLGGGGGTLTFTPAITGASKPQRQRTWSRAPHRHQYLHRRDDGHERHA